MCLYEKSLETYCMNLVFTQSLHNGLDAMQVQFLSLVQLIWIQTVSSQWAVAVPSFKSPICDTS